MTSNKYLGVIIHDKHQNDDDDDIIRYVKSLYSRGNMLISRFKICSSSIKVKLFRLFLCKTYGSHLWSIYKQYTYKRILVAFNNIYRNLFGILWGKSLSAIYANNNIDSFRVLVRKNVYSFTTRLGASSNLLVQCIVSSLFYYHSSSRWTKILNL